MSAEHSVAPDINPEVHLGHTTQQLRRKVEMIFFRYTQPELEFNEVMPDHVLNPFLNYADAFAAVHPEMPSLDVVALDLEKDSQNDARDEVVMSPQQSLVASMLEPLSVKGTYIPFRLYRLAHPRRLSDENVEKLKATFYPDLVTNRLASRQVRRYNKENELIKSLRFSEITFNHLIACNVLFSYGRSNMFNLGLLEAADEVDRSDALTAAREWLLDKWQQMAASDELDDNQRAIAQEFVALHVAALKQGIDLSAQSEVYHSADLSETGSVDK